MSENITSDNNGKVSNASLNGFIVRHRKFREIRKRFETCRESAQTRGEPSCLLLRGETGVGKTTIMMDFLEQHPPRRDEDRKVVPVLTAVIPIPATIKNLATEMLAKLGDPLADRGTLEQRDLRLRTLLQECGTEVIILDEFQHFIERKSDRVILNVSDWLKNLISNTGLPVILIGLPECERVLEANPQLMRRFGSQVLLRPFEVGKENARQEFEATLREFQDRLSVSTGATCDLLPDLERFYAATGGRIALLMKVMKDVECLALQKKPKAIERRLFEKAFRDRVGQLPARANPFNDGWDGQFRDPLGSQTSKQNGRRDNRDAFALLGHVKKGK